MLIIKLNIQNNLKLAEYDYGLYLTSLISVPTKKAKMLWNKRFKKTDDTKTERDYSIKVTKQLFLFKKYNIKYNKEKTMVLI